MSSGTTEKYDEGHHFQATSKGGVGLVPPGDRRKAVGNHHHAPPAVAKPPAVHSRLLLLRSKLEVGKQ